jgi:hypothetical protein
MRRCPPTTHTIEMAQIKEINAKLGQASGVVMTAMNFLWRDSLGNGLCL